MNVRITDGIVRVTADGSVVFVVDDDPAVRNSLDSLFRSIGHCVELYESTEQFLAAERPEMPGCIVLDVRLRGRSGLQLKSDLSKAGKDLPVVFITGHGDIPMSVLAMKSGAVEFLTKPVREQDILDAVHRGIELDRERRRQTDALSELRARFGTLTPREREVMSLVTRGLLNKQVAEALGLSEVTVKVHRGQVMHKMRATSLPELVRMADRLASSTERS